MFWGKKQADIWGAMSEEQKLEIAGERLLSHIRVMFMMEKRRKFGVTEMRGLMRNAAEVFLETGRLHQVVALADAAYAEPENARKKPKVIFEKVFGDFFWEHEQAGTPFYALLVRETGEEQEK